MRTLADVLVLPSSEDQENVVFFPLPDVTSVPLAAITRPART